MSLLAFVLNLPLTLTGIIPLILSVPYEVKLNRNPIAFIFKVKSFWWAFGYLKNARAMAIGNIILLGPKELKNDLAHEIIHVKQCQRYPIIQPFWYLYELMKNGYRNNRFEEEAYSLSKSIYEGKAPQS